MKWVLRKRQSYPSNASLRPHYGMPNPTQQMSIRAVLDAGDDAPPLPGLPIGRAPEPRRIVVNTRLMEPAEISDVPLLHFDGASTWYLD
jgi:hypothetical protein